MKNKIIAILLVLLSITAVGCSSVNTEEVKNLTLDNVIKTVNEKNKAFLKRDATYDEAEYMKDYENINFSDAEVKSLYTYDYNNVTKEEAKEDVDMMFRVLKSLYAGYTYFGGDVAFNQAKEEIKDNIDSYEKSKINPQALAEIIRESLGFVKDSHFGILGEQCFDEAHTYYEASRLEFRKTDSGYFTIIDDKRYYLPEEYEKYLKITISESGELVYGIFAVVTDSEKVGLPVEIKLTSGSKTKDIETEWIISAVGGDQAKQSKYSEENSVAISSLSDMSLTEYNFAEMNDFLNNSKKHSEHDYSILDLRENDGGTAEIDMMWIYGYTGEFADISYPLITYMGDIYNEIFKYYDIGEEPDLYSKLDIMDSKVSAKFVDRTNQIGIIKSDGLFDTKLEGLISNPNTLFVLQSKHNYSSGEIFLMMLDGVENVLSVGTNTNGCIHTGGVLVFYLPNSSLGVGYSSSIFAGFDKDFDVYGLEPDIYVADDDAQEAVLRCIKYYSDKEN